MLCGYCQADVSDMTLHIKLHHPTVYGAYLNYLNDVTCPTCKKVFSLKQNKVRHSAKCGSMERNYNCGCGKGYKRLDYLKDHQKKCNGQPTPNQPVQQAEEAVQDETPKVIPAPPIEKDISTEEEVRNWTCNYCAVTIDIKEKLRHCQSIEHKEKALIPHPNIDDTFLIDTCFDDKMVTYRIMNQDRTNLDMRSFLDLKKEKAAQLVKEFVEKHTTINAQLELTTKYTKISSDG